MSYCLNLSNSNPEHSFYGKSSYGDGKVCFFISIFIVDPNEDLIARVFRGIEVKTMGIKRITVEIKKNETKME